MASDVGAEMARVASGPGDAGEKRDKLEKMAAELIAANNGIALGQVIEALLGQEASSLALFSRHVLHYVATHLNELPKEQMLSLGRLCIERLQHRVVSFEEEDGIVRQRVAACLEADGQYAEAAEVLRGAALEGSSRPWLTEGDRFPRYLKIVEMFLKAEDVANAEKVAVRASMIAHAVKDQMQLARYKAAHAEIFDKSLKFTDAASRYYDLSVTLQKLDQTATIAKSSAEAANFGPDAALSFLSKAVTCCILSPAGTQRTKLLVALTKDQRTATLPQRELLKKVFTLQIIRKYELQLLAATFASHHQADIATRDSVIVKSIMQHNVLAVSMKAHSVKLSTLADICRTDLKTVEDLVGQMVVEDSSRQWRIDQKTNIVRFSESRMAALEAADRRFAAELAAINMLAEKIETEHSLETTITA